MLKLAANILLLPVAPASGNFILRSALSRATNLGALKLKVV
jgi:hypothetical protein